MDYTQKINTHFTKQFLSELKLVAELEVDFFSAETIAHKNASLILESIESNSYTRLVLEKIQDIIEAYPIDFNCPVFFINYIKNLLK